jgi:hypothetical protein
MMPKERPETSEVDVEGRGAVSLVFLEADSHRSKVESVRASPVLAPFRIKIVSAAQPCQFPLVWGHGNKASANSVKNQYTGLFGDLVE